MSLLLPPLNTPFFTPLPERIGIRTFDQESAKPWLDTSHDLNVDSSHMAFCQDAQVMSFESNDTFLKSGALLETTRERSTRTKLAGRKPQRHNRVQSEFLHRNVTQHVRTYPTTHESLGSSIFHMYGFFSNPVMRGMLGRRSGTPQALWLLPRTDYRPGAWVLTPRLLFLLQNRLSATLKQPPQRPSSDGLGRRLAEPLGACELDLYEFRQCAENAHSIRRLIRIPRELPAMELIGHIFPYAQPSNIPHVRGVLSCSSMQHSRGQF